MDLLFDLYFKVLTIANLILHHMSLWGIEHAYQLIKYGNCKKKNSEEMVHILKMSGYETYC